MGPPAVDVVLGRDPIQPLPLVQRHTVSESWAINTYNACDLRCVYCITNAQGQSVPRRPAGSMGPQLEIELDAIGPLDRVAMGPFCDVYPGPEAELGVTREALEVLMARGIGFNLITKGTTVVRDADLFTHAKTVIQISLSSVDAEALARLEPGAPSPDERLAALRKLCEAGVQVSVQVAPWIPGVTDVSALLARIDPSIRVQVTPLRLPDYLERAQRSLSFTQLEVNDAYRNEYERVGPHDNVWWSRPPRTDGAPPHISDMGSREVTDWTTAPAAPEPSPGPYVSLLTGRLMRRPRSDTGL